MIHASAAVWFAEKFLILVVITRILVPAGQGEGGYPQHKKFDQQFK